MPTIGTIYRAIDEAAPFSSALGFDNVGVLLGSMGTEVHRAMIVLDVTHEVIEEAVSKKIDLIVSHHPVIFAPLKSIAKSDVVYQLIANGISVICCHTNLDLSNVCGVNLALGKVLGLKNIRREDREENHILFMGELEQELFPNEFAAFVQNALQSKRLLFHAGETKVKTVAFCSGAGADQMELAKKCGADAFLTGEMKYHEELEAVRSGLTIVTAGHFETEIVFAKELAEYLKDKIQDVWFTTSESERPTLAVR